MSSPRILDLSNGYSDEDDQFLRVHFLNWHWEGMDFKNNLTQRELLIWALLSDDNQIITELKLDNNDLKFNGTTNPNEGAQLKCALKKLSLKGNSFTNKGFKNLLGAVNHSDLEELDLTECELTHNMMFTLAEALEKNYTLRKLNLSANPITDPEVLQNLALALTKVDKMKAVTLYFAYPSFDPTPDVGCSVEEFDKQLDEAVKRLVALVVYKKMLEKENKDQNPFTFTIDSMDLTYFSNRFHHHVTALLGNQEGMARLKDHLAYELECQKFSEGKTKAPSALYQYTNNTHTYFAQKKAEPASQRAISAEEYKTPTPS